MRFVKNTRMETKASLDRQTTNNLAAMHDLKARMAALAAQNELVAKENDELRNGAIATVTTIQQASDLQHQVEELSVTLAEKAVTIRKLLEANATLEEHIKEYQGSRKHTNNH